MQKIPSFYCFVFATFCSLFCATFAKLSYYTLPPKALAQNFASFCARALTRYFPRARILANLALFAKVKTATCAKKLRRGCETLRKKCSALFCNISSIQIAFYPNFLLQVSKFCFGKRSLSQKRWCWKKMENNRNQWKNRKKFFFVPI